MGPSLGLSYENDREELIGLKFDLGQKWVSRIIPGFLTASQLKWEGWPGYQHVTMPWQHRAMTLHGHTWQSASESPRQGVAWSCLLICKIAFSPWRRRFDHHWHKASGSGQTDTHKRPLMLVEALLGPTGPDSGNNMVFWRQGCLCMVFYASTIRCILLTLWSSFWREGQIFTSVFKEKEKKISKKVVFFVGLLLLTKPEEKRRRKFNNSLDHGRHFVFLCTTPQANTSHHFPTSSSILPKLTCSRWQK